MANIITADFRARNATSFADELSSNSFYTFISSMEETNSINSDYSKREFLEKTLFGKIVLPQDVYYMVRDNRYTPGTVYDAYDDQADMTNKTFFVTVYPDDEDTGNYYVFKCLNNNYGVPATDQLVYSPSIPNQTYNTTDDGYTWKYLFTLSNFEYRTLATNSLIPIIEDISVANSVIDGIESIVVTNPGESYGYQSLTGTVEEVSAVAGNVGSIRIAGLNGAEVSQVANYYVGQSISITKDDGSNAETRLYTVDTWVPLSLTTGILELKEVIPTSNSIIDDTCTFTITPRIEIIGNGSGASAIAIVNNTTGAITGIQILEPGAGYTNATARVVDPLYDFVTSDTSSLNITANRALIRPIISPPGGHNSNLKEELLSRHVLINTEISTTDNNTIPTSRTYTKIGLVKNPELSTPEVVFDNRLRVKLDSITGIVVDDILFQIDPATDLKRFEAKVHSINGNDIYLINYMGPYQNQANSDLSFDTSLPLKNNIGQQFTIANNIASLPDVTVSPYVQRTGEVFYINTFNPIERTITSLEQYKILLQF